MKSRVGQGSTFTFTALLEIDRHAAKTKAAQKVHSDKQLPTGLRILLVEDNNVNQLIAQRMLGRLGCEVELAENGAEAIECLERSAYDLILMDCQMPIMDGFEATQEIRKKEGDGAHIPIVAMTANAMQGDRERCLAAGMDDHLAKPATLEGLKRALLRWAPQPQ